MALKGKKPSVNESRLKCMFYGAAGVGKTTAAIQFPKPYIIDTERSTSNSQYVKAIEKSGGSVFVTSDFDEIRNEVKELLRTKHEYKTLVIDSMTLVYNDLLEKSERKIKTTDFGRHYAEANKRMKHFIYDLLKIDMNVIITCHSKNEYGQNLSVLGTTFDSYKKLDFIFDVVFEVQKQGNNRIGIVKKTRVEGLPDQEKINFSYEEIANRYGRDILERDVIQIQMATEDQIIELEKLINLLHVDQEVCQKWLDKSKSETWSDMKEIEIEKCIQYLKDKIPSNK